MRRCPRPRTRGGRWHMVRGHYLIHQTREWGHPCGGLAAADHVGAVNIVGGEIRQCPAARIFRFYPYWSSHGRGHTRSYTAPGLNSRFLVGGQDKIVLTQSRTVEHACVEIQHARGFHREVGVAGKDPGPMLPGLERVRGQPPVHRRGGHTWHDPAPGGPVQRAPGSSIEPAVPQFGPVTHRPTPSPRPPPSRERPVAARCVADRQAPRFRQHQSGGATVGPYPHRRTGGGRPRHSIRPRQRRAQCAPV